MDHDVVIIFAPEDGSTAVRLLKAICEEGLVALCVPIVGDGPPPPGQHCTERLVRDALVLLVVWSSAALASARLMAQLEYADAAGGPSIMVLQVEDTEEWPRAEWQELHGVVGWEVWGGEVDDELVRRVAGEVRRCVTRRHARP